MVRFCVYPSVAFETRSLERLNKTLLVIVFTRVPLLVSNADSEMVMAVDLFFQRLLVKKKKKKKARNNLGKLHGPQTKTLCYFQVCYL